MWKDQIVNEVRRIREGLSEQHNFDVSSIFTEIRKNQAASGKRIVCRERQVKAEQGTPHNCYSTALHSGR